MFPAVPNLSFVSNNEMNDSDDSMGISDGDNTESEEGETELKPNWLTRYSG